MYKFTEQNSLGSEAILGFRMPSMNYSTLSSKWVYLASGKHAHIQQYQQHLTVYLYIKCPILQI
jgi:hypothetical protein